MRLPSRCLPLAAALTALCNASLPAQKLHVNDRWEECAIVLHSSLSQSAWHQFASELGLVTYFRPVSSARPLGAKKFEVAILQWSTRIDASDDAWNDTFSHPDSAHYLFEGDALPIPGLMLRMGVTDRMDVGAYFTKNTGSNYGIAGGQLQYNVWNDEGRRVAAAGRLSVAQLFGPADVNAGVYGADFVVSKGLSIFEPYAVISGYLSRAHERTSKVDLRDENVLGVQGTVGLATQLSVLRIGVEYTAARVSGYSFKLGFGS